MAEVTNSGSPELNVKKLQLHWLLQITKAINYNLPAAQLFEIYETVMRDQLKVQKLVLYVHEQQWHRMLSYGVSEADEITNPDERFHELNALQFNSLQMPEWVEGFESIIPVYHNEKALAYAFIGDLQHREIAGLKEVLPFIHTITNIIVVAIENKRLTRDAIRQAQMQRELELAARMQNMLFPAQLPVNTKLELAVNYLPHQQVGGDYYDYIELNEEEILICLADVSGKGISAALLMSNFQANLNARAKTSGSLQELIVELNNNVNKSAKGEKYITVFVAVLNLRTHLIRYVNAGHNPPLICNNGKVTLLEEGTTGLGMFEELPFLTEGLAYLSPGSILFCYTDGVVEQENNRGDIYGMEPVIKLLEGCKGDTPLEELHAAVLSSFAAFKGTADALDDVTLLSCRPLS
jgi:sigma-B regulation protein RsbU (phosphoserine phosphatase)